MSELDKFKLHYECIGEPIYSTRVSGFLENTVRQLKERIVKWLKKI